MKLETLAGSINGRLGDLDWVPIHYIYRSTPRRGSATSIVPRGFAHPSVTESRSRTNRRGGPYPSDPL